MENFFISSKHSLLNGWNYLIDTIQNSSVYFYIQSQLNAQTNPNHPFYGYSWEDIEMICERCGFAKDKGIKILDLLELFNFIKKEQYPTVYKNRREQIQKWNMNNPGFQLTSFNQDKDFFLYLDIPKITNPTIFKDFYNQTTFLNILYNITKNKSKFTQTEFESFPDFKNNLENYCKNNALDYRKTWERIITGYWKEMLEIEDDSKKIRLTTDSSQKIKIFGITYRIENFSKPFSQEYINILKIIEKEFNLPITELFMLFERTLGLKKDFTDLITLFDKFKTNQRVVVLGFRNFLDHCKGTQNFIQSRKLYFLKSLAKFIENELISLNQSQFNNKMKIKPINKHRLNDKFLKLFKEEYKENSKYFEWGYNCPNCNEELIFEDFEKCPKCKLTLDWEIENLELIKQIIKKHREQQKELHASLLR